MENSGVNTNGSQFFITYGPLPEFDGHFTIIGRVLTGMDVLSGLTARDPQPGTYLAPGNPLISVTIQER
jgi:cyclophilin family peptidyl-prolyl cis-trans isomerase